FEQAPRERQVLLDRTPRTVARDRAQRARSADFDHARRRGNDDRKERTRVFEELALRFGALRVGTWLHRNRLFVRGQRFAGGRRLPSPRCKSNQSYSSAGNASSASFSAPCTERSTSRLARSSSARCWSSMILTSRFSRGASSSIRRASAASWMTPSRVPGVRLR